MIKKLICLSVLAITVGKADTPPGVTLYNDVTELGRTIVINYGIRDDKNMCSSLDPLGRQDFFCQINQLILPPGKSVFIPADEDLVVLSATMPTYVGTLTRNFSMVYPQINTYCYAAGGVVGEELHFSEDGTQSTIICTQNKNNRYGR